MTETHESHDSFAFEDGGRTFRCHVEASPRAPRAPRAEAWWWFQVSTDDDQRYAPFRAEPGDTDDGVRRRVLAYYDDLLARRAAPAHARWQRPPAAPR